MWTEAFISCGEPCKPSLHLGNAELEVNCILTLGKVNYILFTEVFLCVGL